MACGGISVDAPLGVTVRSHIAGAAPLNTLHGSTLHRLSHPTDVSYKGLYNTPSIYGRSDLDARATQLKYVFQLSGRERPCVELVQNRDRGITVLRMMGCCECLCGITRASLQAVRLAVRVYEVDDGLTRWRVSRPQQVCPANTPSI
eukprot:6619494-Pyramimonas_sp.AAC.1